MDNKVCVVCSTENKNHFTYCRYCGALLPVIDRAPVFEEKPENSEKNPDSALMEDGISSEEYCAYIGKGAHRIFPVFKKFEETKSNFYWCFPVLVLGLLFGFYGIAAWFFCRRMEKLGFLATLCGVLGTALDFLLNLRLTNVILQSLASLTVLDANALNILSYYDPVSLSRLLGVIATFFASVFALSLYKNKAKQDILKEKVQTTDKEVLLYNLEIKGGRRFSTPLIPFFFWLNTLLLSMGAILI